VLDTKSKNILRRGGVKALLFLLAAGLFTFMVLQAQIWLYFRLDPQLLWSKSYEESLYQEDLNQAMNQVDVYLETENPADLAGEDFQYLIQRGESVLTNAQVGEQAIFEKLPKGYYVMENQEWQTRGLAPNIIQTRYPYSAKATDVAYLGFTSEFFVAKEAAFQAQKVAAADLFRKVTFAFAGLVILMGLLIFSAGKRVTDNDVHAGFLDRVYSDLLLFPLAGAALFWVVVVDYIQTYGYEALMLTSQQTSYLVVLGVITFVIALMSGLILASYIRKVKIGTLWKHTLIYGFFHSIWDFLTGFLDGRRFSKFPLTKSLYYRQWMFIGSSFLMVLLFLIFLSTQPTFFLIPMLLEGVLIYFFVKYNHKTFEEINLGFNESLEEQMKAERMKVALVTNVSHDLKTPLTSIISYTDLLSKEANLSENAQEYVQILSDKSNQLNKIVADLFDLAKSTTGNIQVTMEPLDLKTLLQQAIADIDDEISQSSLVLRSTYPEHGVLITSDGNKLYRVFQNIMDNALKYGMAGTRIFLDLTTDNEKALVSLKNTAGYEMDFTEEEILQRFNRGDASRTTEGSGLGLSIAESFTHVCGGDFDLEIDGDQFKIKLSFPLRKPA
jgi:signal transduction histidine kinase